MALDPLGHGGRGRRAAQYSVPASDRKSADQCHRDHPAKRAPDTTPPTVPQGLTATVVSSSRIDLSWTASTDTGGWVAGYRIFRNGVAVATSATNSYSNTGLQANTRVHLYGQRVRCRLAGERVGAVLRRARLPPCRAGAAHGDPGERGRPGRDRLAGAGVASGQRVQHRHGLEFRPDRDRQHGGGCACTGPSARTRRRRRS